MFVLILKRVCLANTASPLTARLNCLWDTALSRVHSNALLSILSSANVCHEEIASSSVIDHLTRFVVLIPTIDKAARTIVHHLIERMFSVFGPPETLHSDQGKEFENWSRNYSLFLDIRKHVQPHFVLRVTLI